MQTKLYNQSGNIVGDVELPDKIFGLKLNPNLVIQVLEAQRASARQVLAHTKGRGEVRGGGRKPWRQKGTGRARHASIRSPIWKGGGVTFGPTKERNFSKKINKKMKRQALFMVLSAKVKDKELLVLNGLKFETGKTKEAFGFFRNISPQLDGFRWSKHKQDSVLLVIPDRAREVWRAVGNLPFAKVEAANNLNIKELLEKKYLIMSKEAVSVIEKTFKV